MVFFNLWAHVSYFLKDFALYLILLSASLILLVLGSFKAYKSQVEEKKKKIIISALFSFFAMIFIFSCFEAYFRYRYDDSDGLGFLKTNVRWQARHVVYNAYGNYFFRNNRDFTPQKTPGVTRIGVLGDSNAFGAGIKNVNNRFSNLLETELNNAGYRVEVYNFAIPGIGTDGEYQIYKKVRDLNLDIIILSYFLNKAQPLNSTSTPIISKNSQRAKILEFISAKSFFLDFLYWRFSSRYQNTIKSIDSEDLAQYKNPSVLAQHEELTKSLLDQFDSDGSKSVVLIFPYINLIEPTNPLYSDQLFADQLMSAFFKDNDVPVVDLFDYLKGKNPKDLMASSFDAHPNEIVHKIAAQKLFEQVVPLINKPN